MIFTKEQEKIFEEMNIRYENETIFICEECKKELKGMKEVRIHCRKFNHYSYKSPVHNGVLMLV